MARPVKWRKITEVPKVTHFIPAAEAAEENVENILLVEEVEAIRLKDLFGLEQEECAEKMGVSRPTFQRILLSAREKVADSLINGKAITIKGGNYTTNICSVTCSSCHKEWQDSIEHIQAMGQTGYLCPSCGSKKIGCGHGCKNRGCKTKCCKREE